MRRRRGGAMGGRERKARKPPRLGELRRGRLRGSSGQAEEGAERSAAPHEIGRAHV